MSDYKDDRAAPVTIATHGLPHICGPMGGAAQCTVTDGVVTMHTPLPKTYPEGCILLDTNALHEGSVAGFYEVAFTSPTQGTIGKLVQPYVIDTTQD